MYSKGRANHLPHGRSGSINSTSSFLFFLSLFFLSPRPFLLSLTNKKKLAFFSTKGHCSHIALGGKSIRVFTVTSSSLNKWRLFFIFARCVYNFASVWITRDSVHASFPDVKSSADSSPECVILPWVRINNILNGSRIAVYVPSVTIAPWLYGMRGICRGQNLSHSYECVNLVPADYKRLGKMKSFISHSRWLQCFCFIQRLASLRSHRRDIGCGLNSLMASLLMSRQSEERPAAGSCVWKRGGGSRSSHYEIRQTVFSSSSDVIAPALLFE